MNVCVSVCVRAFFGGGGGVYHRDIGWSEK